MFKHPFLILLPQLLFVDLLNLSHEKVFLNELLLKDQLVGLQEIDAQAEIIDKSGTY